MLACPCQRHEIWVNHVRNSSSVSSRWSFWTIFYVFVFCNMFSIKILLYVAPIRILLFIKTNCRKVKKETIQKTESHHLIVSVLCFLVHLLLSSATSEAIATSFLTWNCCLKQIHTSFIFFQPEKGDRV